MQVSYVSVQNNGGEDSLAMSEQSVKSVGRRKWAKGDMANRQRKQKKLAHERREREEASSLSVLAVTDVFSQSTEIPRESSRKTTVSGGILR